jgi:hypothetical protein
MSNPCQVCGTSADDHCERCEKPTCDEHFFDQVNLGLCETCRHELDALVADGHTITNWPYRIRTPFEGDTP